MKDYGDIIKTQKEKIRSFVTGSGYTAFLTENELMGLMEVPKEDEELFRYVISELISDGSIMYTKKHRLAPPTKLGYFVGTLRASEKGGGFVTCDDFDGDIYVPERAAKGALHTDEVLVRLIGADRSGFEGEITRIIKRGKSRIVGVFSKRRKGGSVTPLDRHFPQRIDISSGNTGGADDGDTVVIRLRGYGRKKNAPEAYVERVLGRYGEKGVDILSVMAEMGIDEDFPEDVKRSAAEAPVTTEGESLADREDLRGLVTVTIDGEDAKDLDDAVSCVVTENGTYELGVHIADVSHYVKAGSELDKEALRRGTSVYLVDRVIPMLPKELSNGICSLNCGEDRLCLSCIMEIDGSGRVISHRITKGIINVDMRMTYTAVNSVLTDESSAYIEEYGEFLPMLLNMDRLRVILHEKRMKRGALDFDTDEAAVILDDEGRPCDIVPRQKNAATGMIEEFMIAANETVAEEFFGLGVPFMYRSHESPDEEKYAALKKAAHRMGYDLGGGGKDSSELGRLLGQAGGRADEKLINMLALRSMKQAVYSPECVGHYGLASRFYCHFTSPIRRYPDLFVHRVISGYLEGKTPNELAESCGADLEKKALLCSQNERRAENAERESVELKKTEFMADRIGESFDALISGIAPWGIYVRLPNTVEGMVSYRTMKDDRYVCDEDCMSCIGKKTGRVYSLGDSIRVTLEKADTDMRRLDFVVEGSHISEKPKSRRERAGNKRQKKTLRRTSGRTKTKKRRKRFF